MSSRTIREALGATIALALITHPIQAQDPMPLTRLTGPIVVDGLSNEAAWQAITPFPLTVYQPTFGAEPTERTEIRVAYDDEYIYVAGRMYDSDPNGVRTYSLSRDGAFSDDLLSIVLDTYNDHESASWFTTNPAGVRSDRAIANDGEFSGGGDPRRLLNSDWNTFWDAAAVHNGEGWFAEMRIPFSSLGFQDDEGRIIMGMSVYRWISRKGERHLFPAISPDFNFGFAKPSLAQRVSLEGVFSKRPVYITPYALGGLTQATEVGIDLKYNVTSNLTLDLTANTDFAQVEADDQQINLTRFSLFFPEKRQFFQERASTFEFATGGQSRMFHSRRIGLNEEGERVRIFGGARLVGRVGKTDIGILNMQTASEGGLPSENFGVVRLRRQVFNSFSNVGGMATTRFGDDGTYNIAVGADAIVRPFGNEYVTLKWVQSFDETDVPGQGFFDASRFIGMWQRRNDNGFSYVGEFIRSGRDYNPGIGFQVRRDFTFLNNQLQYKRFASDDSPLRTVAVINRSHIYTRNRDNSTESGSIEPRLELEFKNQSRIQLSVMNSYEGVLVPFQIPGGLNIPSGNYWFHAGNLRIELPRGGTARATVSAGTGSFYDGWRTNLTFEPEWRVSPHFTVSSQYEINMIRFSDRNESIDAHLVRLRIDAALDGHLSANLLTQYNSADNDASINARVRYHFSEGNDLWLVYNEGFNTNRDVFMGPRLPFSQSRAFLVKYTYTFIN